MQCRSGSVKSTGLNAISEGIVINHCQFMAGWLMPCASRSHDLHVYNRRFPAVRAHAHCTSGTVRGVIWP